MAGTSRKENIKSNSWLCKPSCALALCGLHHLAGNGHLCSASTPVSHGREISSKLNVMLKKTPISGSAVKSSRTSWMQKTNSGLEQPKHAESWNTSTFKSMDSLWHKTQVDQCALGTMLPDSDGTYLPVKKPPHWHCQVHYWLRHFMQYVLVVNNIFLWKDLLQALEAALQLLPRTSQVCVNSWRRTSTTS